MMTLVAYYPLIKLAHVTLVILSGALFAIRGAAVLARQHWPMRKPWRLASYFIDTGLLGAGVSLWVLLQLNPVQAHWLGLKLILLLIYILLGSYALKRARTFGVRLACYSTAITLYLFIAGIALAHHPLGWIQRFAL